MYYENVQDVFEFIDLTASWRKSSKKIDTGLYRSIKYVAQNKQAMISNQKRRIYNLNIRVIMLLEAQEKRVERKDM